MSDSWPVVLDDVSFSIGGAELLRGVSMRFAPNGMNVILGPNGAGKSTLMRIAAGRLAPTAGRVTYGGDAVRLIAPRALALRRAFLSQHVEIDFAITAEEVVLMGRYPHFSRVPRAYDREVVRAALDLVGMTSRRRQPYPTLSGGEQQKIQLARVLAQIWAAQDRPEPRILFLDEPTASLDIHYQLHILDLARGFLQRNCTIVLTLHDLNLAAQYGDRFFVLEQGKLAHVADGRENLAKETLERVFAVRTTTLADDRGNLAFRFHL